MAAFGRMLVQRYGTNGLLWRVRPDLPRLPIRSWQIWIEPNLKLYRCGRQNARQYTNLLRAVSNAIKRPTLRRDRHRGNPEHMLKTAVPCPAI